MINSKEILKKAQKGGYAIGAFNTSNLEITQAIVQAAQELKSPVIIQTTPSAIEYAGLLDLYQIIRTEIENTKIKAVLHLDHGKSYEIAKSVIDIGYHSVMIDGSDLDFDENVELTRRVVHYAHSRGVTVEAELGSLPTSEDGKISHQKLTNPDKAGDFVRQTKIDSLAVSIGNIHGGPKHEIINLSLLHRIRERVAIPLVLHGSSGISDHDLRAAVKYGICKVNIDTNLRRAAINSMDKMLSKKPADYRDVLSDVRNEVKLVVRKYIKLLGSVNKS